jgi:Questin oxidase-like
VLAIYALGASPELINDAYYIHLPKLLPVLVSPESITEGNFVEHLGDEKYLVSLL